MTSFAQTSDGDLEIVNGRPTLVSGVQEKAQKIRNRLALSAGEWVFDRSVGTPWFGLILGKPFDEGVLSRLVQDVILSVPGVASVTEVRATFDGKTREASVTWRAFSDEGTEIPGGDTPFVLRTPS